jgi:hemerythrin superfamily protein
MSTEELQAAPSGDAIDQLKADHQEVKELFDQFEQIRDTASDEEKDALVKKIGDELAVHESVENEVFFPAVRNVLRKEGEEKHAAAEQDEAGEAIQALQDLTPGEPGYEDKVAALGKQVAAHADEEETQVFPAVQESDVDTDELGEKMTQHKQELEQKDSRAPF